MNKLKMVFQLGIALGFLIPPLVVKPNTVETIGEGLHSLFMMSAIVNTVIFAFIFVCKSSVHE